MSNLTLAIDEEVLKRARIRAIEQGTSVNAVVRMYLESYAGLDARRRALGEFVALAANSEAGSADTHRQWTRDQLYEENG